MKINVKYLVDLKFPCTKQDSKRDANINQFAKAIGVSNDAANKIYDGITTKISFDTLENICRVLDCTPSDIFDPDDLKVIKLIQFQRSISNKDDTE